MDHWAKFGKAKGSLWKNGSLRSKH